MTEWLEQTWNGFLEFLGLIVIPEWGDVIGWIPLLLLLGLIGPVLTLGVLVWLWYLIRRPRTAVRYEEGASAARLDEAGRPVYPAGLPFCPRDGLVYPPGSVRCDACHDLLAVRCPMCDVERRANLTTCGNCGLVLKVENRVRVMSPAGPPPGGAAAA